MNSKAQASIEYLTAMGFSFFITLIVFSAMFGLLARAEKGIDCAAQKCPLLPEEEQESFIGHNVLLFTAALLFVYFAEFFFVMLFMKFVAKPKKTIVPKKSRY